MEFKDVIVNELTQKELLDERSRDDHGRFASGQGLNTPKDVHDALTNNGYKLTYTGQDTNDGKKFLPGASHISGNKDIYERNFQGVRHSVTVEKPGLWTHSVSKPGGNTGYKRTPTDVRSARGMNKVTDVKRGFSGEHLDSYLQSFHGKSGK